MALIWKDTTSYSQGRERIATTWSANAGEFRITVTCSHLYHKGEWVLHCAPWFDTLLLNVSTKEEAQANAIEMVRKKIDAAHAAFHAAVAVD